MFGNPVYIELSGLFACTMLYVHERWIFFGWSLSDCCSNNVSSHVEKESVPKRYRVAAAVSRAEQTFFKQSVELIEGSAKTMSASKRSPERAIKQ